MMKDYLVLAMLSEFFLFLSDFGQMEFETKKWKIVNHTIYYGENKDCISLVRAVEEYFSAKQAGWGELE